MVEFLDDGVQGNNYEPQALLPIATKWGTIGGAIAVLLSVVFYTMGETIPEGTTSSMIQSALNFGLYGVIAIQAQRVLRAEQGDYLKYAKALGVAFVALMLMALLSTIWSLILTQILDPSLMEAQQQMMLERMAEQGMTESEIEDVQEGLAIFRNPIVSVLIALVASSILMVIIAAITAAFTKKNPPEGY